MYLRDVSQKDMQNIAQTVRGFAVERAASDRHDVGYGRVEGCRGHQVGVLQCRVRADTQVLAGGHREHVAWQGGPGDGGLVELRR